MGRRKGKRLDLQLYGLSCMQLAAQLGDHRMLRHMLRKQCQVLWVWGPVTSFWLDLKGIDCVLLMGLPQRADAYVHVAGRTAREGRRGRAVSLIFSEQDEARLGECKAELGIKVSSVDLKWLKPET